MKKISLLSIFIFLVLNSIFAVTYDNLYVVGNACLVGIQTEHSSWFKKVKILLRGAAH